MEELDDLARVFLLLSQQHDKTLILLTRLIELEVGFETESSTLFRGNTFVTKMLSDYCRIVGLDFLRDTLREPIDFVLHFDKPFEVQKIKLASSPPLSEEDLQLTLQQNALNLIEACTVFLDAFFSSVEKCPRPVRIICRHLGAIVGARFPANRLSSIGGLIFLRFFSPAVASPESLGLMAAGKPVAPQVRRLLLLVSKLLQNLSNGILVFSKEHAVPLLDRFLEDMVQRLYASFERLVDLPDDLAGPAAALEEADEAKTAPFCLQSPPAAEHAAIAYVANFCRNNIHKLAKAIVTDPSRLRFHAQQLTQRGYLKKMGGKVKKWRTRWFILKGHLLYYFSNQASSEPLGVITLENVQVVGSRSSDEEKTSFTLITTGRTYHLKSKTEGEKIAWIDALTHAQSAYYSTIYGTPGEDHSGTSSAPSSAPTSPTSPPSSISRSLSPLRLVSPTGSDRDDTPLDSPLSSDADPASSEASLLTSAPLPPSPQPPASDPLPLLPSPVSPVDPSPGTSPSQLAAPCSGWVKPTLRFAKNAPQDAAPGSPVLDFPIAPNPPNATESKVRNDSPLTSLSDPSFPSSSSSSTSFSSSFSSSASSFSSFSSSSLASDCKETVDEQPLASNLPSVLSLPPHPAPPPPSFSPAPTASPPVIEDRHRGMAISIPSSAIPIHRTGNSWTRVTASSSPTPHSPATDSPSRVPGQSGFVSVFNATSKEFTRNWIEIFDHYLQFYLERPSADSSLPLDSFDLSETRVVMQSEPHDLTLLTPGKSDLLIRFNSAQEAQQWSKSLKVIKLQFWKGLRKVNMLTIYSATSPLFKTPASHSCSLTNKHFQVLPSDPSSPPLLDIDINNCAVETYEPQGLPSEILAAFCPQKKPRMMMGSRRTEPTASPAPAPAPASLSNLPYQSFFSLSFILFPEVIYFACDTNQSALQWFELIKKLQDSKLRRTNRRSGNLEEPKKISTLKTSSPRTGWLDIEQFAPNANHFCLIDASEPALLCYRTPDAFRPNLCIPLHQVTPSVASEAPFSFSLTPHAPPLYSSDPPSPTHRFLTSSLQEALDWVDTIQQVKLQTPEPASDAPSSDAISQRAPLQRLASQKILARVNALAPGEGIDLKGYLNKRGVTNRSWKRRWFVLCNSYLLYFESERSSIPLGDIAIQQATFREDAKPGEFIIQTPDREFYLQASTPATMYEWLLALKKAKAIVWKKQQSSASSPSLPEEPSASKSSIVLTRTKGLRGSRIMSPSMASLREGWLEKRGGRANTGWKHRWCVVQADQLLYYKGPQNRDACGMIPLAGSFCSPVTLDQDDKAQFTLTTRHRVYFLRAVTIADATQWSSVLTRTQSQLSTETARDPSAPPPSTSLVGKQGYLHKQGGQVRNWKRRYFILQKDVLRYYMSPSDPEPLGEIPLLNSSIDVATEVLKRPFAWQISSRFRNYYLAADDDFEMASWMEALRVALENSPEDPRDQKRFQLYTLLSKILQQLESV